MPRPAAGEDLAVRRLIAALDAEGSAQRSQDIPQGLADRLFDASVAALRSGMTVSLGVSEQWSTLRPTLVLVAADRPLSARRADRRVFPWRRLAPLAAMAACIGLAPLVAIPALGPALGPALAGARSDAMMPVALMDGGNPVEPVLATLLQKESAGSWSGVPMTAIDVSMLHPISTVDGARPERVPAPMIPIVESHDAEFSDFADEFARIREAALRHANRS